MKINKKYGSIIEWFIAIILIILCSRYSILAYGSFSSIKAHQQSERTFHYGPSKIMKTIDLKGGKIYLCRYKDWFSADTVKKGIIKWYPGNGIGGCKIDYSKQVSYSWGGGYIKDNINTMRIFGYVNDPNIDTIIAKEDNGGKSFKYKIDKSKMFIFYWNENEKKYNIKYLLGLNKAAKVIYKEDFR